MFKSALLAIIFLTLASREVKAEILINEFSSNSNPEWVELYNTSSEPVDLTGWTLSDSAQSPEPLTGTINGNSYFVFEKTQGWLNNSGGDSITLEDSLGTIQNSISYGSGDSIVGTPDSDKSAGRTPTGASIWQNNLVWTKGSNNPSPTPSPSPTPTPTPTPTSTPPPTKTPSPTPKLTTKPTKTPTPEAESTPDKTPRGDVLGLREGLNPETPKPTEAPKEGKQIPLVAGIFIIGGLGFVGAASYPFLKNRFSRYNKKSPNDQIPQIH